MSLAEAIRIKRMAAELNVSQLARACDVSVNWMSSLERGDKIPSDRLLDKLTEVFEDTALDLHTAAALQRGNVTISFPQESAGQLVPLLLELRVQAPKLSRKTVRALVKVING